MPPTPPTRTISETAAKASQAVTQPPVSRSRANDKVSPYCVQVGEVASRMHQGALRGTRSSYPCRRSTLAYVFRPPEEKKLVSSRRPESESQRNLTGFGMAVIFACYILQEG